MSTKSQPGANTWPITLVSYVYIRKNLSFIEEAHRRQLLKAFATSLFDPDYIGICDRYGLIPVPDELRQLSLDGIDLIDVDDPEDANAWLFETSTTPGAGQSDYVISQKRKSFTLYEVDRVADDVSDLKEQVRQLRLELASVKVGIAESSDGRRLSPGDGLLFKPTVALVLSAVATLLFGN